MFERLVVRVVDDVYFVMVDYFVDLVRVECCVWIERCVYVVFIVSD